MRRKKCCHCGELFRPLPDLSRAVVCSTSCGVAYGRVMREKAERKRQKARKEALRSKSDWAKLAQTEFNKFIRLRDKDLPCVSCGRYHQGQYHAGHYRTTAAQPALRFNEFNCARQCAPCNNHKSGNITEYRIELIKRLGIERVEWLEQDHGVPHWTVEELKAVREHYRIAIKKLTQYNDQSTNEGEY